MAQTLTLNERAQRLADHFAMNAAQHRIRVLTTGNGARILNCGIDTPGGLQAGLTLARVCLANLAEVTVVPGDVQGVAWAVWSYNGQDAVMKLDGTPEPWTSILAAAAAYRG